MFDTGFSDEEERLRLGELLWDPGTADRLGALGVGPGWSCLEAGAGRGSIAAWLADRGAQVVATDLRADRLRHLTGRGVTVLAHDLLSDAPPAGGFDLVHARLVMQHLPARAEVTARLAAALRPGGVLVLEDTDTASLFSHPDREGFLGRAKRAAYRTMAVAGYDPRCGLRDAALLTGAGLVDVRTEARAHVVTGGTPQSRWYALWLRHLAPAMLGAGDLEAHELDAALAELDDPANSWLSQVMISASARRPAP
ncbi:class I SAM-dependent methyltransferase [Catenuloplanes japonicus]|uniref:class I SAM-dependent methyltransferase n=1 Tax=Catenuloplanes japonicus TaxID=33876 RepID=UPI00068CE1F1|nr:methyltransferase domain-containing protein [Catenuloplanes japonicus]